MKLRLHCWHTNLSNDTPAEGHGGDWLKQATFQKSLDSHNLNHNTSGITVAFYSDYRQKRGRPRIRYHMSDFDLSLIREFRSRPAFYDRNSPLFKDKTLNAQAWQDISNILGYDVALLKDRMLQLRNRYNLEKRRLEQLAEENPGKVPQSPWPLYEHLGFLSEHIRARRSFKRMMPRQTSTDMINNMSGSSQSNVTATGQNQHANGLLTVKMEDEESDAESGGQSLADGNDEFVANKRITLNNNSSATRNLRSRTNNRQRTVAPMVIRSSGQSITIRNIDSMRNPTAIPETIVNHSATVPVHSSNDLHYEEVSEKKRYLSTREQKYMAFGKFVASSLVELPKQQAMLLVEKFTSELVSTSISNK